MRRLTHTSLHRIATILIGAILMGCGGGDGGLLASFTSITGSALDAPLVNSTIHVTTLAPYYASGAVSQGQLTTDASGNFSGSVSLPNTSDPVFATAYDSTNSKLVLTSYLGTASSLTAVGTIANTRLHELNLTPVTTAAVAVFHAINNSYALTPTSYINIISSYNADVLAIAAGVKAVGDALCTPTVTVTNTVSLAEQIATAVGLSSSTSATSVTTAQVGAYLGASCTAILNNLHTQIQSDNVFGPQLLHDSHDLALIEATLPAFTGSFNVQGILEETGIVSKGKFVTSGNNAASLINSPTVTIASTGVITSSDNTISGTLKGRRLALTVVVGSASYSLTGKITSNGQVSGGTGSYVVQAAGTGPSETYCASACSTSPVYATAPVLTNLTSVWVSSGATPVWNGGSYAPFTNGATLGGIACTGNTFPLRLMSSGILPLSVVGECVTPSSNGWTVTPQNTMVSGSRSFYYYSNGQLIVGADTNTPVANPASLSDAASSTTASTWSVSGTLSFLLNAAVTYANTSTTTSIPGTVYYLAGTSTMVLVATTAPTSCGGGVGTCNLSPNGLLTLGNNEMSRGGGTTGYTNASTHTIEGLGQGSETLRHGFVIH
jgi:hypothetical protein